MIDLTQLLAQGVYHDRLRGMRGAFNPGRPEPMDMTPLFVFLAAILATIVTILLVRRFRLRKSGAVASNRPMRFFSRVLKQLGIGLADRVLMRTVARSSGLQQPTVLLFSPELLNRHANPWLESVTIIAIRDYAKTRIAFIAAKLFPPAESAEAQP